MKRASKRSLYPRLGFLKFIFRCMYSLSSEFFLLRVVGRDFTIFLLSCIHPPRPYSPSLTISRYLRERHLDRLTGLRFVMSVFSLTRLHDEEIFEDTLPRPGFIKYRTLRNIHWTCWLFGFLAQRLEKISLPVLSRPIKTSRKLNIMDTPSSVLLRSLRLIILFATSPRFESAARLISSERNSEALLRQTSGVKGTMDYRYARVNILRAKKSIFIFERRYGAHPQASSRTLNTYTCNKRKSYV